MKAKRAETTLWDKWTPVIFEDISGGVTLEAVKAWAEKDASVLAITREDADEEVARPHFHCVLRHDKPVDRKTVNNRIRKHFPNMSPGKTGMSCSQWDGSNDIYDYIAKGNKNDRSKGFNAVFVRSHINLQLHHDKWHTEHERISNGVRKKESAEERRERIIKETVESFKGQHVTHYMVSKRIFDAYKGRVQFNHLEPMAIHCLYLLDPAAALEIHDNWFKKYSRM